MSAPANSSSSASSGATSRRRGALRRQARALHAARATEMRCNAATNCSAISSAISEGPSSSASECGRDRRECRARDRAPPPPSDIGRAAMRRLAPHAPGAGEGGGEDALERRSDQAKLGSGAVRRACTWPEHLGLADHEAVERACHGEQVTQRRRAVVAIERGCDADRRDGRCARATSGARCASKAGSEAQKLDPVAGRDQHGFVCAQGFSARRASPRDRSRPGRSARAARAGSGDGWCRQGRDAGRPRHFRPAGRTTRSRSFRELLQRHSTSSGRKRPA